LKQNWDHQKGALDFPYQLKAETCELVVRDITEAERKYSEKYGTATAHRVVRTCLYGQVTFFNGEHYEETNSAGWNGVSDYLNSISKLLGVPVGGRYQVTA